MAAEDRITTLEYREIPGRPGFRFGSDATAWTRWRMGRKDLIGDNLLGDEWRPLKPSPRPNGYSWLYLGSQKTTKPVRLDEILCEAFRGARPPGTECVHRDGNRANACPENLFWGIRPEHDFDRDQEFREIPELDGYRFYFDGTIASLWATGYTEKTDVWRRLDGYLLDSGHIQVTVKTAEGNRRYGAHHLQCWAWKGPCPPRMECCHNDGDPGNNCPTNLRWDTYAANMEDRRRHGVMVCGEQQWQAKLDVSRVRRIREAYANGEATQMQLADLYGVSDNTISKIIRRETWKHVV